MAGASVRRFGGVGEFAGVSLRGSSFRQVEVYLDGVPLNPDGSHAVDLSSLPVSAFERLDVYRGFAPARFGSAAVGGVLDLVTAEDPVPAALGVGAGSWGTGHSWVQLAGDRGPVDALLTVDQLHTEGDFPYFDDQGTDFNLFDDRTVVRDHAALDRLHALARLRFHLGAARLTLLDAADYDDQDLPGTISAPASSARYLGGENLLSATLETPLGARGSLTPRAWWSYRRGHLSDPDGEVSIGSTESTDTWGTLGAEALGAWIPAPWLYGTALVRARQEVYRPFDELVGEGDGDRRRAAFTGSLGADVRLWSGRLVVTPVMQAEVLDNRLLGDVPYEAQPVAPDGEDVGVYALPRGGVRVTPIPAVTLHANAGSYVRAPDFTELFGSSVGIVGNTDLLPERGTSWEVGGHLDLVAGSAPPLLPFGATLDVAFARARVHDLIAYEPNSQQTEHAVNVGEAFVQTAEGGLVLCAGDVADTSTSVTWTVARNLVEDAVYANKALPNVAPWEVSHTTRLHWQDRVALSHTWTYTGATYTDAANANLQAPRSLHAIALSVVPLRGGPTLSAEVLNLLDTRGMAVRRNPYDDADQTLVVKPLTDFAGYPLPGRTFMVGAMWQPHPKE